MFKLRFIRPVIWLATCKVNGGAGNEEINLGDLFSFQPGVFTHAYTDLNTVTESIIHN